MRKRIFAFLPTTFLLIAPLAGAEPGIVSESAETIRYREVDGTETLLTKHPRRTIVGNASFADPWFTAGGSAIGVPTVRSQQALPEQARDLPALRCALRFNHAVPDTQRLHRRRFLKAL